MSIIKSADKQYLIFLSNSQNTLILNQEIFSSNQAFNLEIINNFAQLILRAKQIDSLPIILILVLNQQNLEMIKDSQQTFKSVNIFPKPIAYIQQKQSIQSFFQNQQNKQMMNKLYRICYSPQQVRQACIQLYMQNMTNNMISNKTAIVKHLPNTEYLWIDEVEEQIQTVQHMQQSKDQRHCLQYLMPNAQNSLYFQRIIEQVFLPDRQPKQPAHQNSKILQRKPKIYDVVWLDANMQHNFPQIQSIKDKFSNQVKGFKSIAQLQNFLIKSYRQDPTKQFIMILSNSLCPQTFTRTQYPYLNVKQYIIFCGNIDYAQSNCRKMGVIGRVSITTSPLKLFKFLQDKMFE